MQATCEIHLLRLLSFSFALSLSLALLLLAFSSLLRLSSLSSLLFLLPMASCSCLGFSSLFFLLCSVSFSLMCTLFSYMLAHINHKFGDRPFKAKPPTRAWEGYFLISPSPPPLPGFAELSSLASSPSLPSLALIVLHLDFALFAALCLGVLFLFVCWLLSSVRRRLASAARQSTRSALGC